MTFEEAVKTFDSETALNNAARYWDAVEALKLELHRQREARKEAYRLAIEAALDLFPVRDQPVAALADPHFWRAE